MTNVKILMGPIQTIKQLLKNTQEPACSNARDSTCDTEIPCTPAQPDETASLSSVSNTNFKKLFPEVLIKSKKTGV